MNARQMIFVLERAADSINEVVAREADLRARLNTQEVIGLGEQADKLAVVRAWRAEWERLREQLDRWYVDLGLDAGELIKRTRGLIDQFRTAREQANGPDPKQRQVVLGLSFLLLEPQELFSAAFADMTAEPKP